MKKINQYTRALFLVLMVSLFTTKALATVDPSVTFAESPISMKANEEKEVKLNLNKNGKALSSLQMNITLPGGIEYVDGSATLGAMASNATLKIKKYNNTTKYNVQILANGANAFGDDGQILSFKVKATSVLSGTIDITNIYGGTTAAVEISLANVSANINVSQAIVDNGGKTATATVEESYEVKTASENPVPSDVQTAAGTKSSVSGVALTATGENSGVQTIVDKVKETGSESFKTALNNATNINIKVDVEVTPSNYTAPSAGVATAATISYDLTPVATVTVGSGANEQKAETPVTNDMINQLKDITVKIYTGFKPTMVKHANTRGGSLIEAFAGDDISYDESTGVTTVTIHHFSDLTASGAPVTIFPENVTKPDITAAKNAGGSINVQIKRTFYKDGEYNTVCLPFGITDIANSPLVGAKVQTLSGVTIKEKGTNNETLELTLSDPQTAIEAGVPYIISWTKDETNPKIENPVFEGVTVTANDPVNPSAISGVQFCGTLIPYAVTANDKSIIFVGTDGKLFWPNVGGNINAFCSYFNLSSAPQAKQGMNAILVDGNTTGITSYVNDNENDNLRIRKLIEKGKVVIISNGVCYDLSGKVIK